MWSVKIVTHRISEPILLSALHSRDATTFQVTLLEYLAE